MHSLDLKYIWILFWIFYNYSLLSVYFNACFPACLAVLVCLWVLSLTLLSYQFTISIIWVIFLLVNRQRVFLRFNSVLLHSIFPVCLQFCFVLDPSFFFVFSQTVFVCVFLFQHFEKWNWNVVSVRTWTRTRKGKNKWEMCFRRQDIQILPKINPFFKNAFLKTWKQFLQLFFM